MKKHHTIVLRNRSGDMVGYLHYATRDSVEEIQQAIIDCLTDPMYAASNPEWHDVVILGSNRVVLTRDQVQRMRK